MSFINMTHGCTGDINALYSNGITTTIYSFNDSPEYNRWDEEVQSIKNEIAAINDKRISGSLSQREQDKKFMEWLDHVKTFTNTFGDARVPDDIKFAVNGRIYNTIECETIMSWRNCSYSTMFELSRADDGGYQKEY